ncbi:hypothetical protein Pla110_17390 [Polystyrenella longa]|uniref:Uncharacterized protein n=1 Tax=Polystyrenella longa TaxID=2528007 RepID=A0A518CLB7_9PLAN|nr:hypothetical protein [Polystyrenella longa]QDU80017.1 hypothetical protein Pla110_17390 [Polystyrenella longa]
MFGWVIVLLTLAMFCMGEMAPVISFTQFIGLSLIIGMSLPLLWKLRRRGRYIPGATTQPSFGRTVL